MAVNYEKPSGAASRLRSLDVPPTRALTPPRRDLEETLPPVPMRDLLAESGANVCVLSADPAFVDVVLHAAGDRYPLTVVKSWSELHAAVDAGRCGIAVLDATLLGNTIVDRVGALAPYARRLVTLVAADRAAASQLVGLLADHRIHRLLMKPSAVGATRLLIESAVARRLKLLEEVDNPGVPDRAPGSGISRLRAWSVAAIGGIAVLLTFAAVVTQVPWGARVEAPASAAAVAGEARGAAGPADASTAAALPTPEDPAAALRQRVDELRAQAELARAEGRLTDPLGAGALEHYVAILALVPDDALARSGVAFVVDNLFSRVEQSLLAGSLDDAASTLDQIRRIEPASTRLAFLDAQLVRALAATAPAAAAPVPERAAPPTELDSMLSLAAARLRRGQLLTPAGDNARDYLERARALDPSNAQAAALRAELATALITAARLVAASNVAAATTIADEARRQGATPDELVALELELAATRDTLARQQLTETLAAARDLIRQGALFAPPADNALARLTKAQTESPQAEGLAAVWAEFRAAASGAADAAARSGDWATYDASLAALSQAPEGLALAEQVAGDVAARRLQERFLEDAIPASQLRLISAPPATYPPEAQAEGLEGWVDVEFVVDRTGQTRDGRVVDARPSSRFDAAALAALSAYRYEPFQQDGRSYERRVRLRIRFILQ